MPPESLNINSLNETRLLDLTESHMGITQKDEQLISYCQENANEIKILASGQEIKNKPSLGIFADRLEVEEKEVLAIMLNRANTFLHSPIFTDSFQGNHSARRIWEQSQSYEEMPVEIKQYYEHNRFNLNFLSLPYTFMGLVENFVEAEVLREEDIHDLEKISRDLERISPDGLSSYGDLSDDEKYRIVTDLKKVFEDIVALLSKK